jgi:type II secretory pathway pseudopilin PulG
MAYCAYCGTEVREVGYLCANCKNPTSGALKPATSKAPVVLIVAIVAIPIVLAIIGILAAIAIPNLLTAAQRAKQKRTMADILTLGTAVEAYSTDHGSEVPKADDIAALKTMLSPTYIKDIPHVDGWGHPLKYECWAKDGSNGKCDTYAIGSAGRDGMWESSTLRELAGQSRTTTNFDCDIVYVAGAFAEYPDGIQH